MSTTTVGTLFTSLTTTVGSILTDNLGLVIAIVGALIGLGFLIRYFKRHIGGR